MPDRMRRPVFGPWSVTDVVLAATVMIVPVVAFVMIWSGVDAVVQRDDWWPVAAIYRLGFAGFMLAAVPRAYRQIGTGPGRRAG